jgi:hypothetical protein
VTVIPSCCIRDVGVAGSNPVTATKLGQFAPKTGLKHAMFSRSWRGGVVRTQAFICIRHYGALVHRQRSFGKRTSMMESWGSTRP